MRPAILYLTYDGVLEPFGSSQVLEYLIALSKNYDVFLLSFEKRSDLQDGAHRNAVEARVNAAGITWRPLTYHKRPSLPATLFDFISGLTVGLWLCVRHNIKLIHARSYLMGALGLSLKKLSGQRLIFDMRGFWPEEKVEAGAWRAGSAIYRVTKWIERKLLINADEIVTLTNASVPVLLQHNIIEDPKRIHVITTATNLQRFSSRDHNDDGFVLGYLGSVGTWYDFPAALRVFQNITKNRPNARLVVVNKGEHPQIERMLRDHGVDPASVTVRAAHHADVPGVIRGFSASVFFIRPSFPKQASAPTKLGELLASGVPCLVNSGVGDMAEIIRSEDCGVVVDDFNEPALEVATTRLLELSARPGIRVRCRQAAEAHFSLERAVESYRGLYEALLAK